MAKPVETFKEKAIELPEPFVAPPSDSKVRLKRKRKTPIPVLELEDVSFTV